MEAAEKKEISVENEAVDKSIFKDCSKIAFYRRHKQRLSKKSTYRALLNSVTTGKDSTRFQIINEAAKPSWKFSLKTTLLVASPRMQGYL
ncbi:neutral alpha-glucosidase C isoform X6 [Hippopotamus amphibius kiboko]|uniref:neutral alpha-glucosidase C isoform X6 n=1 Tax=Hippopotamus amphibius kiboko TaxID=575201 RepID=UPI002599B550|nr:neutral alpha-glucosidase C isoform X6 [Hippopotamus amphibius kiboko]